MRAFLLAPFLFVCLCLQAQERKAPSYPLITHDPYLSVWSNTDELNSSVTRHWTGAPHALLGLVKVDGQTYRFLGKEEEQFITLLPAADELDYSVKYTEEEPSGEWTKSAYNDAQWKTGKAPFGDDASAVGTFWRSNNLWVRRNFSLSSLKGVEDLMLKLHYDDNIEVFINGVPAFQRNGWNDQFAYFPLTNAVKKSLRTTGNVLAIHIKNTAGGAWLDAGLVRKDKSVVESKTAKQRSVKITATQTIYTFTAGAVDLTVTFTSPLLANDLDLLSRPVSYVDVQAASNNSAAHDVQVYLGASSGLAVHAPNQEVKAEPAASATLSLLKAGTTEQPLLQKKGDGVRIDWGYLYVGAAKSAGVKQYISNNTKDVFKTGKAAPVTGRNLYLHTVADLGKVGTTAATQTFLLGYDDIFSVQYFNLNLKAWWADKPGASIEKEMENALAQRTAVLAKCKAFDELIYNDALKAGGKNYATLCELSYRQSVAAHKLLKSPQGEILFLSKENYSGGFINTVDVTYPSAPLFLIYNPDLLKGMLNGIFFYSESGIWKKPYPAHDLGTYPQANGQLYGEDMPVEEGGNMIILAGAISRVEGNTDYVRKHWKTLSIWVDYLTKEGLDPGNQLCTDDFAGHLARNANLAIKAIVGVACYADMAKMMGETATAEKYTAKAKEMAQEWLKLADAGDHYVLAYGNPNSWSQKYNMVWDKILDLGIFPKEVAQREIKYYLGKQQKFGLPLDSRKTYTKSDWIIWTATLADSQKDFEALTDKVLFYAENTPERTPMSDFYETLDGKRQNFTARSVVGGYWIKVLEKKMKP
ncbi:MAG: DUF4965 domain-containing protein [Candidatus Pseudobacter hemicellulosilyticus]|uniref:DUF4965 domain-containing protein n=1 Tax=Candidatus Pseudobacter hemicellulosilyticus TaxID=3121375 RepID=A0AAJ5WP76_9BACT|nr:MAG: DUF4965 domain-containing protein [Pseudobacter sp.]